MNRTKLYIFSGLLTFISGCSENNDLNLNANIQGADSVIVSMISTSGHAEDIIRLSTSTNNAQTISDWFSNGSTYLDYRVHNDSLLIELNQVTCASDPNKEIVSYINTANNRILETFTGSKIGCYGQEGASYSNQYFTFSSDNRLHSFTNEFKFNIGGSNYQESLCRNVFTYSGNTPASIECSYIQYGDYHIDSAFYSKTNSIYYPNLYPNQPDVNGLDLNDIVLSTFIQNSFFILPLIVNKKLSFNTQSAYLIEHIQFPQAPVSYTPFTNMNPEYNQPYPVDLFVEYEFDSAHNNRIQIMTIGSSLRYTFKYKD